jgi:hypothetical protein
MLLSANYTAPRYTSSKWFGDTMVPTTDPDKLAKDIERVATSRRPDQKYMCIIVDRRHNGYDPFPDLAKSVAVLELLRWVRIVEDTAPPSSGIRLSEVPEPVRRNRRVGDSWYIVEAFILVD